MEACMDRLYVLTRTSGRPEFFKACRESVKALDYPEVVHIVHSDDPRNEQYIDCDILVRGEKHGAYMGSAPYNLYNNRLLSVMDKPGWVHFLDDDDMYTAPDIFSFLEHADKNKIHVCRVMRWNEQIFPKGHDNRPSFQTEIFVTWSDLAKKGKWWSEKGGDHYYSRQLTKIAKQEHYDTILAKAQEGKGHGRLIDIGGAMMDYDCLDPDCMVYVKMNDRYKGRSGGKLYHMPFSEAKVIEKYGYGHVTYKSTEVIDGSKVGQGICFKTE